MLINQGGLAALFTGYNASFKDGLAMPEKYWDRLATIVTSKTKSNTYAWLGQFPKLREWVGDRVVKAMAAHQYTLFNKKYEGTVEVDRTDIEDDEYQIFNPLMGEIGAACATHPDELLFDMILDGFTELCFDGQPFWDAEHVYGKSTFSNFVDGADAGGPWFLLNTKRPLKPFIFQKREDYKFQALFDEANPEVFKRDKYQYGVRARVNVGFGFPHMAFCSKDALTSDAYNDRIKQMMLMKTDEGRKMANKPNLLLVGPSNRAAALGVVEAERLANGASNINFKTTEVIVCEYLT